MGQIIRAFFEAELFDSITDPVGKVLLALQKLLSSNSVQSSCRDFAVAFGELFFVQLKSIKQSKIQSINVSSRGNVEKTTAQTVLEENHQIEVVSFVIDTDELLTVQTMGPTIAVVLCLVARRLGI